MAVLRDPVERAYSHYLYLAQYVRGARPNPGHFRLQFLREFQIQSAARARAARLPLEMFKSFGFYYKLLKRYYDLFPKKNLLVVDYAKLRTNKNKIMVDILLFLNLDTSNPPIIESKNVTFKPRVRYIHDMINCNNNPHFRNFFKRQCHLSQIMRYAKNVLNALNQKTQPTIELLPAEIHEELIELYKDDIYQLSDLVGIDFSYWLQSRNHALPSGPCTSIMSSGF
jgi:hypothetical protein